MTPDDLAAIRADIAVLVSNHDGCSDWSCDLGEAGFRAVNALPALLAEVERLTEALRLAESHVVFWQAEVERLSVSSRSPKGENDYQRGYRDSRNQTVNAVLAAIDGDAS